MLLGLHKECQLYRHNRDLTFHCAPRIISAILLIKKNEKLVITDTKSVCAALFVCISRTFSLFFFFAFDGLNYSL